MSAIPAKLRTSAREPAYSRATACSPGRVREPWVRSDGEGSPRTRGRQRIVESLMGSECLRIVSTLSDRRYRPSVPRARELALGYTLSPASTRAPLLTNCVVGIRSTNFQIALIMSRMACSIWDYSFSRKGEFREHRPTDLAAGVGRDAAACVDRSIELFRLCQTTACLESAARHRQTSA